MMDEPLLGLPPYVSTGIVQHLSARDLCTLAQVCILLLEAIAVHLDKETEIPMYLFLTFETFCSQHSPPHAGRLQPWAGQAEARATCCNAGIQMLLAAGWAVH